MTGIPDHAEAVHGSMSGPLGTLYLWRCTCGVANISTSEHTSMVTWDDHENRSQQ